MGKTINLKKLTKEQLIRLYESVETNLVNERNLRANLQDRYVDILKQNKQLTQEVADNDEAVQTMSVIVDAILAETTLKCGVKDGVVYKLRLPMPNVIDAPEKWIVRTEADKTTNEYVVTVMEKPKDEK